VYEAATTIRIDQKQSSVLRMHHDKLDEALREFATLGAGLYFSHIYPSFAVEPAFGG